MDGIIVGLRKIADELKLKKTRTVIDWGNRYHLPLRRDPAGRVYVIRSELINWLILFDQEKQKVKEKQTPRGAVKQMLDMREKERSRWVDGY